MFDIIRRGAPAAAALLALAAAAGCGRGEPESDPAAIDAHLNQRVENEEAKQNQFVAEARGREAVRERVREDKAANHSGE